MPIGRFAGIVVCLLLLSVLASAAAERVRVVRVIDGDTLEVRGPSGTEIVRLIGIDTPETKDPRGPVEFFGQEATEFTRKAVEGKEVTLEKDPLVADRDRYGRLLRYVYLPEGQCLNAEIVAQGYGHAYTRFTFSRMEEFRDLEREARLGSRGLWAPFTPSSIPAVDDTVVHVTRTGTKYHRKECRYVTEESLGIRLDVAAHDYEPCKVCNPPVLRPSE